VVEERISEIVFLFHPEYGHMIDRNVSVDIILNNKIMRRDSSVSTVTDYGLNGPGI
jgi:hypothetical protein